VGARAANFFRMRRYSDEQLRCAVEVSHSWRGVLRSLGLSATSAGAMRSVRRHADRLELDYTHFRGQRRWSDEQLASAVLSSASWVQVCERLGLAGGASASTLRGHALRLGLDTRHLGARPSQPAATVMRPDVANLSRAGSFLAAAWFELCGFAVSWPLEPCRYDLLVWLDDRAERIQVKTTTVRTGSTWTVRLASTRKELRTYDPDEIDQFFVVDGDCNMYLIPLRVVGGLTAISLSAYARYRLPGIPSLDDVDRRSTG
jgi:hypothetical protein